MAESETWLSDEETRMSTQLKNIRAVENLKTKKQKAGKEVEFLC